MTTVIDEEIPGTEDIGGVDLSEETPEEKAARQRAEWEQMPAPYGRVATGPEAGRPKAKPGRPRKDQSSGPRMATPPPQRKASAKAGAKKEETKPGTPDYREGISGLITEGVVTVALVGMSRANTPQGRQLVADAAVVDTMTDALAYLGQAAAERFPLADRIIGALIKARPHANTAGALALGAGQLLVNHGVIPPGVIPGTQPPNNLVEEFVSRHLADENSTLGKALKWMASQRGTQEAAPPAAA